MFPLVSYLLTTVLIQEQNEDAGDAIMSNTLVMLILEDCFCSTHMQMADILLALFYSHSKQQTKI